MSFVSVSRKRPKQADGAVAAKIARLANGGAPRVIDLFAGCGGLSLGFHSAGFELVGAVENDPLAAATHSLNFFSHAKHSLQEHGPVDVTKTDPEELLRRVLAEKLSVAEAASRIDVLIGGPPCQAYSIVGRAKLREIAQHPLAFEKDLRAQLYKNFLHYVRVLKPLAVLIENVPEILRYGTRNVAEDIASELEALGYQVRYTILNAVHYGVPQLRDRMFMIAYINELELLPEFPAPTHRHALPKGYKNLRRDVTAKLSGLFGSRYFLPPVENTESGEAAVTARDAIGDLPPITKHLEGQLKRGARRFDEFTPYAGAPLTAYAKTMRGWPAFRSRDGIYDHVIRYLPRDYKIFARMAPGDEYPQAHALANRMFEEALEARSTKLRPSDPRYAVLKKEYVPPYDPAKFANKWRKIDAEEPVRTITAHIGKDSYSHIHYSSDQARTISVREAARLQSFPDGFKFAGTLDPALRQIGNSVPPLIARALARKMKRDLLAALRHARAR